MKTDPYHRRFLPKEKKTAKSFFPDRIDLSGGEEGKNVHLDPYPKPDASGHLPDLRPDANSLFDSRAAAAVRADVGEGPVIIKPSSGDNDPNALRELAQNLLDQHFVERKIYPICCPPVTIIILIPTKKCLAAMAYLDYFQDEISDDKIPDGKNLRALVSAAIMLSSPGWCGTFGPGVTGTVSLALELTEGNYDMTQMFLLPLIYNYYDELEPEAKDKLITDLLQNGQIQRPNKDLIHTSGGAPDDWSRAGYVSPLGIHINLPETENHVLMIATVRYLTNQLLYQRDHDLSHDNRRNGDPEDSRPSCLDQLLGLLRNYLRNDFAEYNAKPYQTETRYALLNLCSYAYDAEVRLGARMVLDYISAHIAVSSNDLRRMVPFRRRNEDSEHATRIRQIPGEPGFMDVNILDDWATGADPIPVHFALLAGNTRAFQVRDRAHPWAWGLNRNFGQDLTLSALSDYRLPPSIHDLFVNDRHRRFYQRLHRHMLQEPGDQRNCDNMEIYSGSPSYLITAGGEPANHAIPGRVIAGVPFGFKQENVGVAVPISFIPTGLSAVVRSMKELGDLVGMSARPVSLSVMAQKVGISKPFSFKELSAAIASPNESRQLIQLLRFSSTYYNIFGYPATGPETANYGVAPDFACGFIFHLPTWTGVPKDQDGVFFVNKKAFNGELAGFFLAIIKQGSFMLLEAFDTWLHPEINFEDFKDHVTTNNSSIQLKSGQETVYTTFFGNKIHFAIWNLGEIDNHFFGSKILDIEYGSDETLGRADTLADAGNYTDQSQFLSGTILKSAGDAVMEIHNPLLREKIKLDWSDPSHLVRTSEDVTVEEAGKNEAGQWLEVWVDFDWNGGQEGDFYRPFKTVASAVAAVADGGTIKIMPGTTRERPSIHIDKRIRLTAPIGGVTIGSR